MQRVVDQERGGSNFTSAFAINLGDCSQPQFPCQVRELGYVIIAKHWHNNILYKYNL